MGESNLDRLREISEKLSDTEFLLAQANGLIAAIFNGAGEAMLAKDFAGVITAWNPAAERLYGYKAEEAVGQHVSLIVPPEKEEELEGIMQAVSEGKSLNLNTLRRKKNGKIINVKLTVSPVVAANGKIVGASAVAHPANWQWGGDYE